jgi:hypothetical protein
MGGVRAGEREVETWPDPHGPWGAGRRGDAVGQARGGEGLAKAGRTRIPAGDGQHRNAEPLCQLLEVDQSQPGQRYAAKHHGLNGRAPAEATDPVRQEAGGILAVYLELSECHPLHEVVAFHEDPDDPNWPGLSFLERGIIDAQDMRPAHKATELRFRWVGRNL